MIVPYVSSPFHAQAVQAVERTRPKTVLRCCCAMAPIDLILSVLYIDMLRRNMVDGVIVNSLNIGAEAYAEMGLVWLVSTATLARPLFRLRATAMASANLPRVA